jgi:hypothetical protein
MITGELKSKIDAVWSDFWSGGIANSLEVTGTINTWIEADQQSTPRVVVPAGEQLETTIGTRDRI